MRISISVYYSLENASVSKRPIYRRDVDVNNALLFDFDTVTSALYQLYGANAIISYVVSKLPKTSVL